MRFGSPRSHMNLEAASKVAYEAIFSDRDEVEIDGQKRMITKTSKQGLRSIELDGYTFIEQNPEKNSAWGKMARGGSKILWVIENGYYVAQVRDGVFNDFNR